MSLTKLLSRSFKSGAMVYINHRHDTEYLNWYFRYSKKLEIFKNIHQGEDCFIIGNGPSLRQMDLSHLKYHHTFGLNKIYLLFDEVELNLSYHVAVNEHVIQQSIREFQYLNCPSFLSFRPAIKAVPHLENIHFIMTGGPFTFQPNLRAPIPEGNTVTYVAMQIAYYMGFNRVFLIGVDHSFLAIGHPNELQTLKGEDPNHFAPNYFANQQWQLPDLEASELSYHLANFFFRRDGRQIYDATVGGKLKIFPKISYDTAITMCSKK